MAVLIARSHASLGQLQGTVIDKTTREPLPGATVLLPELKQAVTTDASGHFLFRKITHGKFLVQVRMLGYSGQSKSTDAALLQPVDFELEASIIEKNEVVITGSPFTSDNRKMSLPVVPMEGIKITEASADNLMQALTAVPGVSVISTGNGIAKPVIRGLGYNRVVVVNQGVRQEGQQWGSEHGTEIDQFAAEHVEVLKGPASLEYGSDALGGVIHVLEPVPAPAGSLRGRLNSQFASNNLLYGNSLMLEGNRSGFVWQARAGLKSAAPYKTPTETVYNSGYAENAQHILVGLNRQWGYSHLHASRWSSLIGLTEGERDSISGAFIDENGTPYDQAELERRRPATPRQRVGHTRISSTNSLVLGNARIRLNAGFQENLRREYEDSETSPGIAMRLRTGTVDARLFTTVSGNIALAAGISGITRQNINQGTEYIIPDYEGRDGGLFVTGKKESGKSTISGGIRFDGQQISTAELISGTDTLFKALSRNFSAFSGSLGLAQEIDERTTLKVNAGKGYRAPTVPELTSNGLHEGTFRYEIGNPDLLPEHAWELDAGILHDRETFSIHLDLFIGLLDNYIYYEKSEGEKRFVDGDSFPVYRYVQANAFRRGGELTFDVHPVEQVHFENSLAVVLAENTALDRPLPFTPPFRSVHEVRYDVERKNTPIRRLFIKANLENVFKQERIDDFETPTAGYVLLNAGAGVEGVLSTFDFHLFLNIRNITNTLYFDHLSRYKDIGVGGPGRNLTLGLEIDFGK